jgi:hypothetical protein
MRAFVPHSGPDERQNCRSTSVYFGWHNAGAEVPVGQEVGSIDQLQLERC